MSDSQTAPLAAKLSELAARQDDADQPSRWRAIAGIAQSLANYLRTKDSSVDEHTALGQTPLPRTLTMLINEGISAPIDLAWEAVFELLRAAANFCMDHDNNRQLLLENSFPQAIMMLLRRYSDLAGTQTPPKFSLIELKVLKTAVGVLLNASLGYEPILEYLISANVPRSILRLQTQIYLAGAWASPELSAEHTDALREEWEWRSGFLNWSSMALGELLRDARDRRSLDVSTLDSLVSVLRRFTGPFAAYGGPLMENTTVRHSLMSADAEALNEASSHLESFTLDSDDAQIHLGLSISSPSDGKQPLLREMMNFIEFGDYPPAWSLETPTEKEKHCKMFDLCKGAVIKTLVEVAGSDRNLEVLWDLEKSDGWFVHRLLTWIRSNPSGGSRDDLLICATLTLCNLARKESHCVALVNRPHSITSELTGLLQPSVDAKVKHGAMGLLKHLSTPPRNHAAMGDAGVIEHLASSQIWADSMDMAETIQLSAIGVAKHLGTADARNAVRLTQSQSRGAEEITSVLDQVLALVKRSNTVAVKSEGTRVLVQAIKSLCSSTSAGAFADGERETAIQKLTNKTSATALAELVGRSRRYNVLLSEGLLALTLISLHGGVSFVLQALLAPLPPELTPAASQSASQSSVTSPITPPATCLTMVHSILTDAGGEFPPQLKINACSLLGSVGRKVTEEDNFALFIRTNSGGILEKLAASSTEQDVKLAAKKACQAWE